MLSLLSLIDSIPISLALLACFSLGRPWTIISFLPFAPFLSLSSLSTTDAKLSRRRAAVCRL